MRKFIIINKKTFKLFCYYPTTTNTRILTNSTTCNEKPPLTCNTTENFDTTLDGRLEPTPEQSQDMLTKVNITYKCKLLAYEFCIVKLTCWSMNRESFPFFVGIFSKHINIQYAKKFSQHVLFKYWNIRNC